MPKITDKSRMVLMESTEQSKLLIVSVADMYCQGHTLIGATVLMHSSVASGLARGFHRAP